MEAGDRDGDGVNVVWEEGGPVQGRNQKGMWGAEQGVVERDKA